MFQVGSTSGFAHAEVGKHQGNEFYTYRIYENELNFTGLDFPQALKDVPKFEELNRIAINVYAVCNMVFSNIYLPKYYDNLLKLIKEGGSLRKVNLLYIVDNEDEKDLIQGEKLNYSSSGHFITITIFD